MFRTPPGCPVPAVTTPVHRSSRRLQRLPPERGPLAEMMSVTPPNAKEGAAVSNAQESAAATHHTLWKPRVPKVFHGSVLEEVEDWLTLFERVLNYNDWTDFDKMRNVYFSLEDSARTWYENRELFPSWSVFRQYLLASWANPYHREQAERVIQSRLQMPNESVMMYVEDMTSPLRRADTDMAEEKKVCHLMRGVKEQLFAGLVRCPPKAVAEFLAKATTMEQVLQQRSVYDRQPKDEKRSLPGSQPPWKVPLLLVARIIAVPWSTWFFGPAVPPKESLACYRRGGPTSGSRRPPGVVRVYKPFLACHSRSGRQSLLAPSMGPGPRDNLAAIVVQAYRPGHQATETWTSIDAAFQSSQREETPSGAVRVYKPFLACCSRAGHLCLLVTPTHPSPRDYLAAAVVVTRVSPPGRPSTRSCKLELSLPGHAYSPLATCLVHRVTRTGFRSPPAASRSFFGVKHIGAASGLAASSWHPASTSVSAAASGPSRFRPPVLHQGILTMYLPRKHEVRPTRRLYQCVACDARLTSLSARHECPGPATNEPFHPFRHGPSYFNCKCSLTQHTTARHAQEESYAYVPLRNPRKPTELPPVLQVQRPLSLLVQLLQAQLAEFHQNLRPEPPFPVLEDVVKVGLPHRHHPRVPGRSPALRLLVLCRRLAAGHLPCRAILQPFPAPVLRRLGGQLRFPERHCPYHQILVPRLRLARSRRRPARILVVIPVPAPRRLLQRLPHGCPQSLPTSRYRQLIAERAGGRTVSQLPAPSLTTVLCWSDSDLPHPLPFPSGWRTLVRMTPKTVHTTYLSKHQPWTCLRTTPCCLRSRSASFEPRSDQPRHQNPARRVSRHDLRLLLGPRRLSTSHRQHRDALLETSI
ncbi:hypothetical protein HPB51_011773 [Rhipicephalus microplus]|uniref:Retrotransposon gag domain-containing protein n=1 Tax=Rhipicephalus microplus TaxID=6941 RepID=A0A9J6E1B9_RHIMP|nr:hypothetical protein HPB51_011773 [Rhipicephalus microplus]